MNPVDSALATLVEASRSVPPEQRQPIMTLRSAMSPNFLLDHPAIPHGHPGIYPADLHQLERDGLILVEPTRQSGTSHIDVTPAGFCAYERVRREAGAPVERIEQAARSLLDSAEFRARHPRAFASWAKAEELLWASDSNSEFSAIGHHCREAAQRFATSLLHHHHVSDAPEDPASTKKRVASVLKTWSSGSEAVDKFAHSLWEYWSSVIDLGQRQEHGAQKEGAALTWEDGRRLVFGTLMAMVEIDRVVSRTACRL